MSRKELEKIINYIVKQGLLALKSNTNERKALVDYVAIFAKNKEEYQNMESVLEVLGKETDKENTKTGRTFLLDEPIKTPAGNLRLVKIRKPDPTRPQRGAPDFKIKSYQQFKKRYLQSGGNFTLMIRKDYEMIELKGINVLVYIPSRSAGERLSSNKLAKSMEKEDLKKINCIVIHGCPSDVEKAMDIKTRTYDKHWIPWIKKKLTEKGIKVETPLMPEPWHPDYEKFKAEFKKYEVGENTILVGHSCGCAFLVRWLGETKRKIFKLILVAPWKIPDKEDEFRKKFYTYPIDGSIKSRVKEIIMFTADDEEGDGKKSLKIFHQALDGKIIELKGHGHYTENDMGTTEFPELLEVILGKEFAAKEENQL